MKQRVQQCPADRSDRGAYLDYAPYGAPLGMTLKVKTAVNALSLRPRHP
jgi:hypothetical protein